MAKRLASAHGTARFRVVSYNVLSSSLCSPRDFPACEEANLNPLKRLPKLTAKVTLPDRELGKKP